MKQDPEVWRQVVDHLSAGVVLVDPELRVVSWNRWMEAATGVQEKEVLDRPLDELAPRLREGGRGERLREALASGAPAVFTCAFHRALFPGRPGGAGGVPAYQEVRAVPLLEAGRVFGLALLVYDVTSLVLRELALSEAARELRELRREVAGMREEVRAGAPRIERILEVVERHL